MNSIEEAAAIARKKPAFSGNSFQRCDDIKAIRQG
jgi:hypothetical protein